MDTLINLKEEIVNKKLKINEMILKNENITEPELVELSVELDALLNKLLSYEKKRLSF